MRTTWIAAWIVPFLFAAAPQERGQGRPRGGEAKGQEPAEEPAQEPNWLTNPEARAQYYRENLLGAWQLTRAKRGNENFTGGNSAGYALFTEGFMALELHVASSLQSAFDGTFFQTGIHRWQIDTNARLETASLIGTTSFTVDDIARFESPGTRRLYEVVLNGGDELVLRRNDGSSELTFMRLKGLGFPGAGDKVDFYGRPKPK